MNGVILVRTTSDRLGLDVKKLYKMLVDDFTDDVRRGGKYASCKKVYCADTSLTGNKILTLKSGIYDDEGIVEIILSENTGDSLLWKQ